MGKGNKHIKPVRVKHHEKRLRELKASLAASIDDYADELELELDGKTSILSFAGDFSRDLYQGNLEDLGYFSDDAVIGVNNGKTQILRQLPEGGWYFFEGAYGRQRWMQVQVRLNTLNKRTFVCGTPHGVWQVVMGACPFTSRQGGIVVCLKKNVGVLKGRGPRTVKGKARW